MLLPRHVQARILFQIGAAASAATVAGCKGAPPVEGSVFDAATPGEVLAPLLAVP